MAAAEDQLSAKKCFIIRRAALALFKDEHLLFRGKESKKIHFLQIRLSATFNYAVTLENELLSLGVFSKLPQFEINKTRIHDLYPTDCSYIEQGAQVDQGRCPRMFYKV